MKRTSLIFILLSMLCLASCQKENPKSSLSADDAHNVVLSVRAQNASSVDNDTESRIERLDVYSFVKLRAATDYTFEKKFENLTSNNITYSFELVGDLPRQIYYIANNVSDKINFLKNLSSTTTVSDFLSNCLLSDMASPQPSLVMSGMTPIHELSSELNLDASLNYATARLDVVYKYNGFQPDSLILRNAVPASYLFSSNIASPVIAPRQDVRYTDNVPIYLYPNNDATLTVYGKYDGIRVVFDIPLGIISRSTRYNVTVKSNGEVGVDFSSNLIYDVKAWSTGDNIGSQPDWQ